MGLQLLVLSRSWWNQNWYHLMWKQIIRGVGRTLPLTTLSIFSSPTCIRTVSWSCIRVTPNPTSLHPSISLSLPHSLYVSHLAYSLLLLNCVVLRCAVFYSHPCLQGMPTTQSWTLLTSFSGSHLTASQTKVECNSRMTAIWKWLVRVTIFSLLLTSLINSMIRTDTTVEAVLTLSIYIHSWKRLLYTLLIFDLILRNLYDLNSTIFLKCCNVA